MQYNFINNSTSLNDLYCINQANINNLYESNSCNLCKAYYNTFNPNKLFNNCLDKLGVAISYICLNEFHYFFNKPNVVGVDVGYKTINGFTTNQECISVYVENN